MEKLWNMLRAVLAPDRCVSCGERDGGERAVLCAACLARVPLFGWISCPQCGARAVSLEPACHPDASYALIAATSYAAPEAQTLVKELKYGGVHRAADMMALIAAAAARPALEHALGAGPDWIMTAIPLHPRRERERGFNQSVRFAEALRRHEPLRRIPPIHALARTRNTDTQTGKPDRAARRANVAGCFVAAAPDAIRGKNVLLVDDVTTSGATLEEAARVLKHAGAKNIVGLVFAKA